MASKRDERANESLTQALLAVLDGDYDEAEKVLRGVVEADTTRIGAMLALGRLYRVRGEIGRAIRVHQNLLLRGDTDKTQRVAALRGVAEDFKQGGFLQRAVAAFEEYRLERPRDRSAVRALVDLYAKLHDYPRALALRKRLGRDDAIGLPSEADLWVAAAARHLRKDEEKEAYRALRRALRRDGKHPEAWENLGDLERERGKGRRAERAYRRALELDGRRAHSLLPKLASLFTARGKTADFDSFLKERIERNPTDFDAQIARCRSLQARGEVEEALAGLEALLKRRSDHLEALALRTRWTLEREADEGDARDAFEATYEALTTHHVFQRRERLQ